MATAIVRRFSRRRTYRLRASRSRASFSRFRKPSVSRTHTVLSSRPIGNVWDARAPSLPVTGPTPPPPQPTETTRPDAQHYLVPHPDHLLQNTHPLLSSCQQPLVAVLWPNGSTIDNSVHCIQLLFRH